MVFVPKLLMKENNTLTKKKSVRKRINNTLKYNLDLRNDWPEISPREWERLETDQPFRDGFLSPSVMFHSKLIP
jgi:hypothetical protein